MSTLRKISTSRSRKVNDDIVLSPSTEVDVITYQNTHSHNIAQMAYVQAQQKEFGDICRKVIKIKVRKQGAVETFTQLFGCPPGSSHYAICQEYDELMDQEEWGKLTGQDTVALFITLSPEPGTVDAQLLQEDMDKILGKTRKGIAMATWSIEQSGDTEEKKGYHPHVHILMLLDKSSPSGERSRVKRMIESNFKKYKTKSERYLDIKPVSQKKYKDKLEYIKGNKRDKDKMVKVQLDKVWRQEMGFKPVYCHPDNLEIITPLA